MKHESLSSKTRKRSFVAIAATVAALSASVIPATSALADDIGSSLVAENFTSETVNDARWLGFGAACLTAATSADKPSPTQSNLAACSGTQDTAYLQGKPNGFLQLTDNSGGTSSNVLFNRAIPSASGLDISFYQYQFATSNTGMGPADGIGFFLTDGSYTLDHPRSSTSGTGGALGYASIDSGSPETDQGVPHGVLGVGLDVFGNYSNQPYVGLGCSPSNPRTGNTVSVRGAGDGTTGYCLLSNSSGSFSTKSNELQTTTAPRVSEDGQNTGAKVRILVSPTTAQQPNPTLTIYINDVEVSSYTLPQPLPPTVKLGFSSSTGGGHEAHLIRTVSVKSIRTLDNLNLVKTVNHDVSLGGTSNTVFKEGDTVPYLFLVTNTGDEALKNIAVNDPKISDISCAEPPEGLTPASSMTCTGKYGPLTADEAAAGSFTNTATATGNNTDGNQIVSNPSTAVIPTYTQGSLSVLKEVEGNGAALVNKDAEYTVNYSYDSAKYQYCSASGEVTDSATDAQYPAGNGTLTVKADGTYATTGSIPTGAQVKLSEDQKTLPSTSSIAWETPVFSENNVTVGCGENSNPKVTLTNTASEVPGSVSWSKTTDDNTTLLAGSQWSITGPDNKSRTVIDNGENDSDPAEGKLSVNNLAWGSYTLKETQAPHNYLVSIDPIPFTIGAGNLNVSLPAVANTEAKPGLLIHKTSNPATGSTVNRNQTITYTVTAKNTGNVDLPQVSVVDDLSKVLSNASYVAGSASAVIGTNNSEAPVVSGTTLKWQGDLAQGSTVTITYRVKVSATAENNTVLQNSVSGTAVPPEGIDPPTANCTVENALTNPDCTTQSTVVVPPVPQPTPTPSPVSPTPSIAQTGSDVAGVTATILALLLLASASILTAHKHRNLQ